MTQFLPTSVRQTPAVSNMQLPQMKQFETVLLDKKDSMANTLVLKSKDQRGDPFGGGVRDSTSDDLYISDAAYQDNASKTGASADLNQTRQLKNSPDSPIKIKQTTTLSKSPKKRPVEEQPAYEKPLNKKPRHAHKKSKPSKHYGQACPIREIKFERVSTIKHQQSEPLKKKSPPHRQQTQTDSQPQTSSGVIDSFRLSELRKLALKNILLKQQRDFSASQLMPWGN